MELVFQGGEEIVRLDIDRKNKKLKVATSLTNYNPVEMPWHYLFDKGKERLQEIITDKLDDEAFVFSIQASMAQQGYIRVK